MYMSMYNTYKGAVSVTESSRKRERPTPWRSILTNRSVHSLMVAHFCMNWAFYLFCSQLPRYYEETFGLDYEKLGLYSVLPYICNLIM